MKTASVENCRVLELGCTDGGNLIPMALALPGSEFVGIDLASSPVNSGRETIRKLGLTNVELRAGDLREIGGSWGKFDFIIAHGLYSWVPAPVREHILFVSKHNLAQEGVAYVSYNAYPGGHMRRMLRDMMLFHVRGVEDPFERISRARTLVSALAAQTAGGGNGSPGSLRAELQGILERDPHVLFHDELAEIWEPFLFSDFMGQAGRHGLQFLSEANYSDMQDAAMDASALEILRLPERDRIAREQYRDFLKYRRFRQTLLCHDAIRLDSDVSADRVRGLYASSPAHLAAQEGEVRTIEGPHGSRVKTSHPVVVRALECLIRAFPRALHFDEVAQSVEANSQGALAEVLLAMFAAGLVQLHAWRAAFSTVPGERPVASPLARLQAQNGCALTTLRHTSIEAKGQLERALIALLDGTRDRPALAQEIRPLRAGVEHDVLRREVDENLAKAAHLGLLMK